MRDWGGRIGSPKILTLKSKGGPINWKVHYVVKVTDAAQSTPMSLNAIWNDNLNIVSIYLTQLVVRFYSFLKRYKGSYGFDPCRSNLGSENSNGKGMGAEGCVHEDRSDTTLSKCMQSTKAPRIFVTDLLSGVG